MQAASQPCCSVRQELHRAVPDGQDQTAFFAGHAVAASGRVHDAGAPRVHGQTVALGPTQHDDVFKPWVAMAGHASAGCVADERGGRTVGRERATFQGDAVEGQDVYARMQRDELSMFLRGAVLKQLPEHQTRGHALVTPFSPAKSTAELATAPNTPPCIFTMLSAAA